MDLKLNSIQRNNCFRREYKFLLFIVEMSILFKNNNIYKNKSSKKNSKNFIYVRLKINFIFWKNSKEKTTLIIILITIKIKSIAKILLFF